ncbi:MAG: hypothetical protein IPJ89_05005 [Candidatus Iainarchaeum archaeon]|uniref:Nop domain-containing protein n=1 Tax=Candidatus Iainarchaeum sp. TaxID=3101447 RepID=A0A7T9DJH8_9ARCH|nr:MAG: hypothetical protein IPJ89_05005 [Candidatus Diapherotrites archaeon]
MPPHIKEKLQEMRKQFISRTKERVQEQLSGPDAHVVRAVSSAKNLEAQFNLVYEQAIEWYALHFPEMRFQVREPLHQMQLIAQIGERKNYSQENVARVLLNEDSIRKVLEAAQNSKGGSIDAHALKAVQSFAHQALSLKQEQLTLQSFVEQQMRELAPNFSELSTPMIAGQLLSKAGSLKRLAEMPGSTIQVLGAEEALFSHLKTRSRPPKHGYIFNHPLVKTLPKHVRGRMARTLAGKMAICIRTDFFGKSRIVDELKSKMEAYSKHLSKLPFKPKPRPNQNANFSRPPATPRRDFAPSPPRREPSSQGYRSFRR